MTTVASMNEYVNQLVHFGTALQKLQQMTADTDEESAPRLVRNIHEETLDMIGWQVSGLDAAQKTLIALDRQNDLDEARRCLTKCNRIFLEMFNRFYENLFTADHNADLEKLTSKKGTGDWAATTINDLYACQLAMQNACAALLGCWESMAEALTGRSLTMPSAVSQQTRVSGHKD